MKFYFVLIISLLSANSIFSAECLPNSLTVKFVANSAYTQQILSGQISDIAQFRQLLGEHKIKSFVNPALLKGVEGYYKNNADLLSVNQNIGLERIFLITYESPIDPAFASKKIIGFEFVEYAEPKYIQKLIDEPITNDSLLSEQYYLNSINASEAWSLLDTTGKIVKIAVVDTGVDYYHEDLQGVIYINPGEDGIDDLGYERRTNGRDDDKNGFADDWRGWDFGADDTESGFDNDPFPGQAHGTHVSGIIAAVKDNVVGIAGIGLNTKIIPVKIGYNDPSSRNLINSYDGLLYAALIKADVINCSWGSGGYSQAEQDIVNQVVLLGSLIVAAAGNDYSAIAFYPASYDGVISVAAIDQLDRKANFSNYFSKVDVSAPGVQVLSTIPDNGYTAWNGTSMASPVAAAVAGMIKFNFPNYNNLQIGEHLKATAKRISLFNPEYDGLIGTGKVDALNALTEKQPVSLSLKSYEVIEEINDGVIKSGEKVELKLELLNALFPAKNVKIFASSSADGAAQFINDVLFAGDFTELESKVVDGTISFYVTASLVLNYSLPITIKMVDDTGKEFLSTVSIFVNPTWRTMNENNISLTYTSQGNIAYDDFPNNSRGEGFKYNSGSNVLFEGALMVGYGYDLIANCARGSSGSAKNRDFLIEKSIETQNPGFVASEDTYTEFKSREDSLVAPVRVIQSGYQFKDGELDDVSFVVYDLINESGEYQDSVFSALYLDWDIGPSGSNNKAVWDENGEFAYAVNALDGSLPLAGIKMISNYRPNFWAIDNNGDTEENPGVYDGFSLTEKWSMMTNGIGRSQSDITDISMVIGAGPISVRAGDTVRVSFALFSANNLKDLEKTADKIRDINEIINSNGKYQSTPKQNDINLIFPNPADKNVTVEIAVSDSSRGELTLWDISGKFIKELYSYNSDSTDKLFPGFVRLKFDISELSQGQYLLRFVTNKSKSTSILNIIR